MVIADDENENEDENEDENEEECRRYKMAGKRLPKKSYV
jgi:hypothetical protein